MPNETGSRNSSRRRCFIFVALALLPAMCHAQDRSQVDSCTFNIAGGYSDAKGDDHANFDPGAAFQAGGDFRVSPNYSVMANFFYSRQSVSGPALFSFSNSSGMKVNGGHGSFYATTIDPTRHNLLFWRRARQKGFDLYALGGFGWFHRGVTLKNPPGPTGLFETGTSTLARAGTNSGAYDVGIGAERRLPRSGLSVFVESRFYHGLAINDTTRLWPFFAGVGWQW